MPNPTYPPEGQELIAVKASFPYPRITRYKKETTMKLFEKILEALKGRNHSETLAIGGIVLIYLVGKLTDGRYEVSFHDGSFSFRPAQGHAEQQPQEPEQKQPPQDTTQQKPENPGQQPPKETKKGTRKNASGT